MDTHAVVLIRWDTEEERYQFKIIHYAASIVHASIFCKNYHGEYLDIVAPCDINSIPYVRDSGYGFYVVNEQGKTVRALDYSWFIRWDDEVYPNSLVSMAYNLHIESGLILRAEADCLLSFAETLPDAKQFIVDVVVEIIEKSSAENYDLKYYASIIEKINSFGDSFSSSLKHHVLFGSTKELVRYAIDSSYMGKCIWRIDVATKGNNNMCDIIRLRIKVADLMLASAPRQDDEDE